jgi:hypothetical protein
MVYCRGALTGVCLHVSSHIGTFRKAFTAIGTFEGLLFNKGFHFLQHYWWGSHMWHALSPTITILTKHQVELLNKHTVYEEYDVLAEISLVCIIQYRRLTTCRYTRAHSGVTQKRLASGRLCVWVAHSRVHCESLDLLARVWVAHVYVWAI